MSFLQMNMLYPEKSKSMICRGTKSSPDGMYNSLATKLTSESCYGTKAKISDFDIDIKIPTIQARYTSFFLI